MYQEKERLEGTNETAIAIPDTYDNLFNPCSHSIKEVLMLLTNELALRV
ncbi:hypothetical protein [Peribacillus butanolivorans]